MDVPLYDYSRWANFSREELACTQTGRENPNIVEFTRLIDFVQRLRTHFDIPFKVTSAYRHRSHSNECFKILPGQHTIAAIDFQVPVSIVHEVVRMAFAEGCTGIGIKLHGDHDKRFIHLDFREGVPALWSYS